VKRILLALSILMFCNLSHAQSTFNFGMENNSTKGELPDNWVRFSKNEGYTAKIDSLEKHSGKYSLSIEKTDESSKWPFASVAYIIPAKYEGKEIELKAWIKLEKVSDYVGLMLRIDDADHNSVGFENMVKKHIYGTKGWAQYSVQLPLDKYAQTIYIGPILGGKGKLWIDDVQVLIDDKDISHAKLRPDYNPNPPTHPRYGSNPSASGTVKLQDATLYYETYGSGEPLLLLHGDSQSIYAFLRQIPELSKHYKVIAVDTRGQGKSTDLTTGPLSYDLFANDMKQLLDSLHISKTNILGWSDGGNTGLIMAIRYPSYVNKLAITGANLEPTENAVDAKVLKEISKQLGQWKKDTSAHAAMEVRLFTMLLNEPHISVEGLKSIKAPVLVMAGQHDVILEKHTKLIAASIPNSTLYIFKGASHYVPVEKVNEFNNEVISFFDKK
jgi:pimeloyl-ACP methyl ester carboxylesterase